MSLKIIILCYLLQLVLAAATINLEQPGKFAIFFLAYKQYIVYQLFYISIKSIELFLVTAIKPRANITGWFEHQGPAGMEFLKTYPIFLIVRFIELIKNNAYDCWRDRCSI